MKREDSILGPLHQKSCLLIILLATTSVTACSTPVLFNDPLIQLVNVTYSANKIIKSISRYESILPFKDNSPEHPHLNYHNIPIAAINQLLILINEVTRRLKKIGCPVFLIQSDNDPVVNSSSFAKISKQIPKELLSYLWVSSNRHGILYENTDGCQEKVIDFVGSQNK